ncbi:FAD-dependent oxidoreductase [Mycolicibacterium smegmatis]|uniref:Monomeric sarcosine oxidase n=1 Tax=Mycolicibacterium smegmatis (strain MKD8) TaxID=1214915 RepID=A0A2U9PT59_MYCSE|nr:FAD-dependent oxidoreductase [Mycolicibacterium smegmatis]AWT54966.1 Monomeric sarcosine oxidase [Mycolicibacterium smegmatis MKD8]
MKCLVIGAGAWGLPAAAELASRGHRVTLVDRYGPLNAESSSSGPTRLWRIADPDPVRVRMALRGIEAMHRLAERSQATVFLRRGLLWRDDESLPDLIATMQRFDVDHTIVDDGDVASYFPGLRPDGRAAVWQPEAGIVLAEESLRAQERLFLAGGGIELFGRTVTGIDARGNGVRVQFDDRTAEDADVVVIAAGPGAPRLLEAIGVKLPLHPYLEQTGHFGDPKRPWATDDYPCLFDGPQESEPGIYAMPPPGIGYKIGLDLPLRPYDDGDADRSPDVARTALLRNRVDRDLTSVESTVLGAHVCSWTDSPDGKFVRVSPLGWWGFGSAAGRAGLCPVCR